MPSDGAQRKTVDKAMRVLNAFSGEQPELSVGELSTRLDMHKSVVSRLVAVLHEWQMLERDPATRKLRIGSGAFRVGALYAQRQSLIQLATPCMSELVGSTRHSAHLSILDAPRILVIATVESPSALRVIMRVGDQRHLHTTAAGKLFLAFSGPELLEAACAGEGLVRRTPETITARNELEKALVRIRRERLAWNRGENTVGAGAVAAPVLDSTGHMIAALSTVFPLNVVDAAAHRQIGACTAETARLICRQLGRPN